MRLSSIIVILLFLCLRPLSAELVPTASEVYSKAVRLYKKGDWKAAKEYFHQYLAEYSDSPLYITSLYYLGHCYQELKDKKEAASIYNKVIDEARAQEDIFWAEVSQKRLQELVP